jgi:hypothetical protein
VDAAGNPTCANAIPHLSVNNDTNVNQLTIKPDQCANLPLQFNVNHPIGSASIEFIPTNSGDYTLPISDSTGAKKFATTTASGINSGAETVITAPDSSTSMDMTNVNAVRIELTCASTKCGAIIQKLTMTEAGH